MASQMTKVNKVKFIKDIQAPNVTVTGDIEISGNITVQGENIISSLDEINSIALKAPSYFSNINKEQLFNLVQDNKSEDVKWQNLKGDFYANL